MSTQVLCTGCFNILHAGHLRLLEFASRYGLVTVGINSDKYLQNKYGELAVPLSDRSYVLRNNVFVHKVVMFREDEPSELIRQLKPLYYIRGPDYLNQVLPEAAALEEVGSTLIIHRAEKEYNASILSSGLPAVLDKIK